MAWYVSKDDKANRNGSRLTILPSLYQRAYTIIDAVPVPEPSTLTLLALGALGLTVMRRR